VFGGEEGQDWLSGGAFLDGAPPVRSRGGVPEPPLRPLRSTRLAATPAVGRPKAPEQGRFWSASRLARRRPPSSAASGRTSLALRVVPSSPPATDHLLLRPSTLLSPPDRLSRIRTASIGNRQSQIPAAPNADHRTPNPFRLPAPSPRLPPRQTPLGTFHASRFTHSLSRLTDLISATDSRSPVGNRQSAIGNRKSLRPPTPNTQPPPVSPSPVPSPSDSSCHVPRIALHGSRVTGHASRIDIFRHRGVVFSPSRRHPGHQHLRSRVSIYTPCT